MPRNRNAPPSSRFTRTGFTRQVRLNRRSGGSDEYQYGLYKCTVPTDDTESVVVNIYINLSKYY